MHTKSESKARQNAAARIPARHRLISALSAAALVPLLGGTIAKGDPPDRLLNLSIEDLGSIKIDTVFAASKFTEKVTDAPSSVTIVTRQEIAHFGYRTLSDILRATRGFDVTYDRNYAYAGVRGFTSLDDYGSRVLLLVDGHRMNDPIYDTAAIGTDEFLDEKYRTPAAQSICRIPSRRMRRRFGSSSCTDSKMGHSPTHWPHTQAPWIQ